MAVPAKGFYIEMCLFSLQLYTAVLYAHVRVFSILCNMQLAAATAACSRYMDTIRLESDNQKSFGSFEGRLRSTHQKKYESVTFNDHY